MSNSGAMSGIEYCNSLQNSLHATKMSFIGLLQIPLLLDNVKYLSDLTSKMNHEFLKPARHHLALALLQLQFHLLTSSLFLLFHHLASLVVPLTSLGDLNMLERRRQSEPHRLAAMAIPGVGTIFNKP